MPNKKRSILIFSFLFLFLFGSCFLLKSLKISINFVDRLVFQYKEIEVKHLFIGETDNAENDGIFASPISGQVRSLAVADGSPTELKLSFKEQISFDSFSIFFKGNLHSVSSYLAENFDVFYQDEQETWQKIDEIQNNSSSVYQFYSSGTISTNSIKIVVYKAPCGSVQFSDLKFYQKVKVGLIKGIGNTFFEQRKSLPAYFFYSFLLYAFLFIPGYVFLSSLGNKTGSFEGKEEYKIILSPIVTIILLFFIAILYLLTGNNGIFDFFWIIFIFSSLIFLKKDLYRTIFSSKSLWFFIIMAFLITFLVQAERDCLFNFQYAEKYLDKLEFIPLRGGYYGYHGDNILPWRIAKLFLRRIPLNGENTKDHLLGFKPKDVFDRTPGLPLITMVILRLLGESHFIYQRFLNVLASLYYGGAYLLLKKYFSKKVAQITSLLVLLNVPLTFLAFNAEVHYKYFAIFPILLAFLFFFEKKNTNHFLIAILICVGFLVHPMTLIFSSILFLSYFLRYKLTLKFFKKAALAFLLLTLFIIAWALVSKHYKSKFGISSTGLYFKKVAVFNEEVVVNKFVNLVNIVIPNILLRKPGGGKILFQSRDFTIPVMRFSIVFNLTPLMFILFFVHLKRSIKENKEVLLMAGLSPLIYIILYSSYAPGNYFVLYPFIIPCLLGIITNRLVRKKKIFKLIIFSTYIAFMLVSLYFVSGVFITMKCVSIVTHQLFWMIVLMYLFLSGILIKLIAKDGH